MGGKRQEVIRPGDRVKIINPQFVTRVGYPMTFHDACVEVEEKYIKEINDLLVAIEFRDRFRLTMEARSKHDTQSRIVKALAYEHLQRRGFGGRERAIFTEAKDHWKDRVLNVVSKRVVKTGTYFPPCCSGGGYFEDYDYNPGGLADEKTHILLTVTPANGLFQLSTQLDEIEICNVEKVGDAI